MRHVHRDRRALYLHLHDLRERTEPREEALPPIHRGLHERVARNSIDATVTVVIHGTYAAPVATPIGALPPPAAVPAQ